MKLLIFERTIVPNMGTLRSKTTTSGPRSSNVPHHHPHAEATATVDSIPAQMARNLLEAVEQKMWPVAARIVKEFALDTSSMSYGFPNKCLQEHLLLRALLLALYSFPHDSPDRVELVKIVVAVIDKAPLLDLQRRVTPSSQTLLIYATSLHAPVEIVKALLRKGVRPEERDNIGRTALQYAISAKDQEVASVLMDAVAAHAAAAAATRATCSTASPTTTITAIECAALPVKDTS